MAQTFALRKLVVLVGIAGCGTSARIGDGGLPAKDMAMRPFDAATARPPDLARPVDLGRLADMAQRAPDLSMSEPANCSSSCDCLSGRICSPLTSTCESGLFPIYCCSSSECPKWRLCETNSGGLGFCSGSSPPEDAAISVIDFGQRRDGSLPECSRIPCASGSASVCPTYGCSRCLPADGGSLCAP